MTFGKNGLENMRIKISIMTILEKLSIIALMIFLSVVILEVGLRINGKIPTNIISGLLEQNGNSYRLKTNAKKDTKWPAFSYTVCTNSFGFRDSSIGEPDIDNNSYYVFLGASEVFGNGVDYEETFVGIFDDFVSKHGIKALNMAIGGHYILDQDDLFKDFFSNTNGNIEKVFFCVNALHIPKFDRRNDHVTVKNGLLFEKNSWKMAYVKLMMGNLSAGYCFFRDNIRKLQSKYFNFKPTEKSNEFLEIYSKSNRMHDISNVKRFEAYLDSFNDYCYKKNITPIYVYTPITDSYRLPDILSSIGADIKDYDTEYYERLMNSYCKRNQLQFINLRPVLQPYYDQGIELRFKLDPHYNKFTNRILGEYIIKQVFPKEKID